MKHHRPARRIAVGDVIVGSMGARATVTAVATDQGIVTAEVVAANGDVMELTYPAERWVIVERPRA